MGGAGRLRAVARARAVAFAPSSSASRNASLQPPGSVHSAVARVVAPGRGSVSYGSGTLVYADETRGVVVTNWHVVNEATGPVSVHFPDGFYSLGTVQMIDRDWDLAAILIRKPNAQPVPIADRPPRPGETLTIAGYGAGQYRAASGPCTQYVAPGLKFPFEMVEVAVSARQGDSGGPIFNSRGELAGVLFGEGNGRTSGSYCGRVRWFLTSVVPRLPGGSVMVASGPPQPALGRPGRVGSTVTTLPLAGTRQASDTAPSAAGGLPLAPIPQPAWPSVSSPAEVPRSPVVASTRSAAPDVEVVQIGWHDVAGDTLAEQAKTVLAGVGVLAVLLQALRWLSREGAAG